MSRHTPGRAGAPDTTRFSVYVVPSSPRPGPDGRHGGVPRLRVAARPRQGRANAEVRSWLTRLLGADVRVVAGASGRRKLCEATVDAATLHTRLDAVFGAEQASN